MFGTQLTEWPLQQIKIQIIVCNLVYDKQTRMPVRVIKQGDPGFDRSTEHKNSRSGTEKPMVWTCDEETDLKGGFRVDTLGRVLNGRRLKKSDQRTG